MAVRGYGGGRDGGGAEAEAGEARAAGAGVGGRGDGGVQGAWRGLGGAKASSRHQTSSIRRAPSQPPHSTARWRRRE